VPAPPIRCRFACRAITTESRTSLSQLMRSSHDLAADPVAAHSCFRTKAATRPPVSTRNSRRTKGRLGRARRGSRSSPISGPSDARNEHENGSVEMCSDYEGVAERRRSASPERDRTSSKSTRRVSPDAREVAIREDLVRRTGELLCRTAPIQPGGMRGPAGCSGVVLAESARRLDSHPLGVRSRQERRSDGRLCDAGRFGIVASCFSTVSTTQVVVVVRAKAADDYGSWVAKGKRSEGCRVPRKRAGRPRGAGEARPTDQAGLGSRLDLSVANPAPTESSGGRAGAVRVWCSG
jgi:hypothetical protein